MEPDSGSPIQNFFDFKAMHKAQEDSHWKFGGGTTLQPIGPGLGDAVVKALGGPELPREKFMVGTTHFTYDQYAQKWPHALTPEYLAQMGPMISRPGQLGYVLVLEGETLGSPEAWIQPQWYPKGFVETRYELVEDQ